MIVNSYSLLSLSFLSLSLAQSSVTSCASTLTPTYPTPSIANGWEARIVANKLTNPRGLLFDSNGQLLIVQQGKGITALSLKDGGGACIGVDSSVDVIKDDSLTHGIELSPDGKTIYASSPETVSSWSYDAGSRKVTSDARPLITGMTQKGHATRTLLLSRKAEGLLLVSWGSQSNLDSAAEDVGTGVSQIRAFNITNITSAYDFKSSGLLLGWGLRNSVGVAEEPKSGGIYSVENSVDDVKREGKDIHQDNPGEELNFHGYLNGTSSTNQGRNFGYPSCFSAWDVGIIPSNGALKVGTQFAIGDQNNTVNDTFCSDDRAAPRLTFPAHTAPLDIKFNSDGTSAWITFHGSWDRKNPIGYKLSVIEFANGSPVSPADSTTAAIDIMTNIDNSKCPDDCFRPVGLAWDKEGRLFMSSDSTGEIYVIVRSDGSSADAASPTAGLPSATTTGATATSTRRSHAGRCYYLKTSSLLLTLITIFL